jgi:putative PEP-CTERM system TPR-repeat lipoprotein
MGHAFKNYFLLFLGALCVLCVGCDAGPGEDELIKQSQLYLTQGKVNSATIQLRNVLQKNPQNGRARLLLGQVYLAGHDLLSAEKELLKAGDYAVAPDEYLPALAEVYLLQGDNEKLQALPLDGVSGAIARGLVLAAQGVGNLYRGDSELASLQINEALALAPGSPYVQIAKARLSVGLWEEDFARQEVQAVLEVEPGYPPAWSLLGQIEQSIGNIAAAEAAYSKALATPLPKLSDFLRRAQMRVQLGDMEGAQRDLDQVKKEFAANVDVHYTQGLIYFRGGWDQDASQSFLQVLSVNERHPRALYYSALTNMRLGNLDMAERHAERLFKLAPGSLPARKLLARVRLYKADLASVNELLEGLIDAGQADPEVLSLAASALYSQGKIDEALPLLQQIVELQPDLSEPKLQLAIVLLSSGKDAEGFGVIETVLEQEPQSGRAFQILVATYLQRGEFAEAFKAAQRLQALDPENLLALQLIANIQIASGERDKALATLNQIVRIAPGDRVANYSLAELAIADKDYPRARTYYERVLAANADDLFTLLRLVRLDAIEQRAEDMVNHLQMAASAHPSALSPRLMLARYYLITGQPEKSAPLLGQLNPAQSNQPEALELQGLVDLAQGQYEEAKVALRVLAGQQPESASVKYLLARAYTGLGNDKSALRQLQLAADLEPENFGYGLAYARALLKAQEHEEAASQLNRLGRLKPDDPTVLRLQALLAHESGDDKTSAALLEEVFASDPSTVNLLAVVGQLWNQGSREKAVAIQESWLLENPDDVVAAQALAGAYAIEGQYTRAVAEFEKLLENDGSNVVALNELAWLLRENQTERAVQYAIRANELQPNSPALMDTLAVVLYYNENFREARKVMQEALSLSPANPSLRFHGAMIDAAAGDSPRAVRTLQALLADDVEFSERQQAIELLEKLRPKD